MPIQTRSHIKNPIPLLFSSAFCSADTFNKFEEIREFIQYHESRERVSVYTKAVCEFNQKDFSNLPKKASMSERSQSE